MYLYVTKIFFLEKISYNKLHPFTSWIPISVYIVFRNLIPAVRQHHLSLFSWLGKITLETYISQFHIWLRTSEVDAQPKMLLSLIPNYPLVIYCNYTTNVFWLQLLFWLSQNLNSTTEYYHSRYVSKQGGTNISFFIYQVNFGVCTLIYICISRRLFDLTNDLRRVMIPSNNNRILTTNVVVWLGILVAMYLVGACTRTIVYAWYDCVFYNRIISCVK